MNDSASSSMGFDHDRSSWAASHALYSSRVLPPSGCPVEDVGPVDAEGGGLVDAAVSDVACHGGVVDELVVDACEGFGLAEGEVG